MTTRLHISTICLVIVLLTACKGRDAEVKQYPKKIVGRWVLARQISVVNAYDEGQKTDTTVIEEDKEYKDFAYKPAEIEYGSEGTYLLVLKDYNDEIKLRRPGLWKFNYDTLVYMGMDSTITDRYVAEVTDTTLLLRTKFDDDDDGKTDDLYEGFYRKLIR